MLLTVIIIILNYVIIIKSKILALGTYVSLAYFGYPGFIHPDERVVCTTFLL